MTADDKALHNLARRAAEALLSQKPLAVAHEPGWLRDGFPLPIKRNKTTNESGTIVQDYRPLAILEYVDDVLSGGLGARRQRAAKQKKEESGDDRS